MPIDNPSFEDEDALYLGFPDVWTVEFSFTAMTHAGYGDGSDPLAGPTPIENFEGDWDGNEAYLFAYADPIDILELLPPAYDTSLGGGAAEGVEDFEEGWDNNYFYLFALGSNEPAQYDAESVEDFEEAWNNDPFLADWFDVINNPGVDGLAVETYEAGWGNDSYQFVLGSTDAADYDMAAEPVEDFEEAKAPVVVSANPSTDRIEATSHGLNNDEQVTFTSGGGALPGGLYPAITYWVINKTANDFQVSLTLGGAAVDLTDTGSGTITATADKRIYWTSFMETL